MKPNNNKHQKCIICKMMINWDLDQYCILTQFDKLKEISIGFYHVDCYREKFILTNQQLKSAMDLSKNILSRVNSNMGVIE